MPYAKINNINIYYEVHGKGEPLVFLSGLSMNHIPWTIYQVEYFVNAGYQVIVMDNRDVGRTQESDIDGYKIRTFAEDTSGLLIHLGVESVHVIGYSMGGMIALEMVINNLIKPRSLTLVGSTARQGGFGANFLEILKIAKEKWSNEEFWRFMANKVLSWKFFENEKAISKWLAFVTSEEYYQSVAAFKRQADACISFDVLSQLHEIEVPVHVVVGEYDEMLAPRHSQVLVENIQSAKLSCIPDYGHAVYSEGAEIFNPLVLEFLNKAPPKDES